MRTNLFALLNILRLLGASALIASTILSASIFPQIAFASGAVIILTSGGTWTVPSDWTSANNTIEVIGGGGSGGARLQPSNVSAGGTGGGGGAYSKISNITLTPGSTVSLTIGGGGAAVTASSAGGVSGNTGGDTYFNGASCAAASACAKGGGGGNTSSNATASGGLGGASASGVGTTKYSGGNGGDMTNPGGSVTLSTGGGGAAGLNGAGNSAVSSGVTGGYNGGRGDAGSGGGGAGGVGNTNGGPGGSGAEYDTSHGSGGGGGASVATAIAATYTAGAAGAYGAGGGGTAVSATGATAVSGAGAQGLIVITYALGNVGDINITKSTTVNGNVSVFGAVAKGSGTFVIDHPLDPKNKLLYHSFVESPDVLNMYDGITTLNNEGRASVSLPDYFLLLNRDSRYLLTPIGASMPNLYIAQGVHQHSFLDFSWGPIIFDIAGGKPGGKVSWQVSGIRQDPFILANPIIPEVDKTGSTIVKKGQCLFPPLCQ